MNNPSPLRRKMPAMRFGAFCVLNLLLASSYLYGSDNPPDTAVAWFTDADLEDALRMSEPQEAGAPMVEGTVGKGVQLTHAMPIDCPILNQHTGLISFWIKPEWSGNDNASHVLLRIGDPTTNGLLIEKSDKNMLRYVMASPGRVTASRYDVSHWQAGQWHQVTVAWFSQNNQPFGLPLFLDEPLPGRGGPEAVDGPHAINNTFLNLSEMSDQRVWIGDETSKCVMDELIIRSAHQTGMSRSLAEVVYRDYYRTAPFENLAIDHAPNHTRSDRHAVAGHPKQFGMTAEIRGTRRPLTDFTIRYGCWGERDAKPFIKWSSSNPEVAAIDANGLATGVAPGECTMTAEFRGTKVSYPLTVITPDKPDLSVLYLTRLPRLDRTSTKNIPSVGDPVQTVAHIGNYGLMDAAAGTDRDGQFVFPMQTDRAWDDPRSDMVEHGMAVWNPFGQSQPAGGEGSRMRDVPFTSNTVETEGVLLVRVVSGENTELHWLLDLDFHRAFMRGNGIESHIPLKTSLRSSESQTPIIRPEVPKAVSVQNRRPTVAIKAPAKVSPGETFTVRATDAVDPEGQPIEYYRWILPRDVRSTQQTNLRLCKDDAIELVAPKEFDKIEIKLRVYDGLRWSEEAKTVIEK